MKNRKLMKSVFNTVVCTSMAFTMFALTACNVTPEDPGDNDGDNPPAGQDTKLDAPVITLNDNVISWGAVSNADAYEVYEGTTVVSSQTTLSYVIDRHDGEAYTYTVKATSTSSDYTTSDASNSVTYNSVATYTVTFMMDEIVFDKQTVVKGEKASTIATDPAKPGYVFDKWVTEKNGSVAYNFDTAIIADTTVYAGWTAKVYDSYKVTFETNGGSAVSEQDVTAGGKAEEPIAPTKENFDFAGWYVDEDLTEKFDFNTAIDKATNLYAKWTLQTGIEAVTKTTTWEFNAGSFDANNDEENNYFVATADSLALQGSMGTFHGLNIDATTGKLTSNGTSWYQFNATTKISFYVNSACSVKLTMYNGGLDYTVNGVAAKAEDGFTYSFKGADKVTIESTANGYIGKIELIYPGAPLADGTEITFGSQGNYQTVPGVVLSGQISSSNADNSQIKTGATVSFPVSKGAKVEVTAYSDATYVGYTIGMQGEVPSETKTGNFTFEPTKAGTVVITGAIDNNYLVKIKVTYSTSSGEGGLPANCERVTTNCDIAAGLTQFGNGTKLSADTTIGRFTFGKDSYFNTSTGGLTGNVWNNQKQKLSFEIIGVDNTSILKFDAKGASSGTLILYKGNGTVVKDFGTITGSQLNLTAENLEAGSYYLVSEDGSCRIGNISITETIQQGSPVSMTVKPATVDFLKGGTFSSSGLNATVNYGTATKIKTEVTVDSSSVDMNKEGEYVVRVFYTELGETVTATYTVKVYSVMSLTYSTYTTSGKTQTTLPTVYTVGGTFSVSGLTVNTIAKCGTDTKSFIMKGSDYDISTPDLSTVGEKKVTITAKANSAVTATFTVNVVEKAEVVENTVTISVDRSKPVSSTNFHTIMGAMSYLGNFETGVKKVVNIADGEYFEKVWINLPNVQLNGSATKTPDGNTDNGVVICFDAISGKTDAMGSAYGTDGSGTVSVTNKADNFVAKNITFKNYYNTNALYNESLSISGNSQAVALYVGSNSASFYNCKMTGYHDTLYTNVGNHYYKNCWIEGRTDFIFGQDANAYFDHCTIYTLDAGSQDGNGGYVCAVKPSTANTYSFVFNGCTFDGPETGATDIALGRAWGADMKMVVINCEISGNYSTNAHTAGESKKQRYCTMSGNEPKPENMLEYNNTGAGAITESIANTCTVDATAATTYGIENLATILGFTPENN